MKIRNGFVSNSSSSSFLLIGVKLNSINAEQKELLESKGFDSVDNYEEPSAIGFEWRVSEYEVENISIKEINDSVAEIKSLLGGGINVSVFFGERHS